MVAAVPARSAGRLVPAALGLATAWLLPTALHSFALGPARGGLGRCPSLRAPSSAAGSSLPSPSLSLSCGAAAEEQQHSLHALPLVLLASVAAAITAAASRQRGRGRRGAARVVRAAEGEDKVAAKSEEEDQSLADRLEDKLAFLREREELLISRIAAVQDKIETIESVEEEGAAEEGEAEAGKDEKEAEDTDAKALKAAEALAEEAEKVVKAVEEVVWDSAPTSNSSSKADPLEELKKELKILEGLADAHEDVTKKEIEALEALEALASGKKKKGFSLREAGAKLREKVAREFKAMKQREAALLENIQDTKAKIEEVEKAAGDSKAVLELRMLASLASAYEDTTAEEIKALQKLANEGSK